ncbi:RNA chaperone Hfq [Burkholderiaceae bacterium FT117]|uniref:RNA chaperone Hfq n=1 Tax=Zeimonas sediminis TaxID=2944268 RepID=UPI002342FAD8|nr:RNA chaperone Hfq [Zeimonas sediminis]MCM5569571.1 RNA chaperone Hfq [Zeimonas sediminis]
MPQTAERDPGARVRSDGRTENAQFMFLNRLRRERSRVEIYLVSGTRLQGRIQSFDGRMLLLATETGVIALYHQATATVQRSLARPKRGMPRSQEDRPRKVMLRPRAPEPAEERDWSAEPEREQAAWRRPAEPGSAAQPATPAVVIKRRRSRLLVKPDEE